ncbi:hypothetical protein KIM372_10380 [Bombiscardovia nodaiensis]|uniref:RCC1-like domain-containing protein n=1 Tax=Bombiscardovia nodaiensis TaxID=2932181 RepID=A0ABN6SDD2_9BIFI|nr:hypothetical protein KIM372_10380 [Bombiscardovia nodaiensis]
MRRFRSASAIALVFALLILGGGQCLLTPQAHADPISDAQGFSLNPTYGPIEGGNDVAIDPPFKTTLKFKRLLTGSMHMLGVTEDDTLWAWGANSVGQLGNGISVGLMNNAALPVRVRIPDGVRFRTDSASLAVGLWHNLAIDTNGNIWSWGVNETGELGDGSTTNRYAPVRVQTPAGVRFKQVAASSLSSLAVDTDGNLWGWGRGSNGELGDGGAIPPRLTPVKVIPPVPFTDVQSGEYFTMALDQDGNVWAWGNNNGGGITGMLGVGSSSYQVTTPSKVIAPCHFKSISVPRGNASSSFVFALGISKETGELYSWGGNEYGQLGDGTIIDRTSPVHVGGSRTFISVSAGGSHVLAIDSNHTTWAWGSSSTAAAGTVGDGTIIQRHSPVQVLPPAGTVGADFKTDAINAGYTMSSAIGSDGRAYAWGINTSGQLGDGSTVARRTSPVRIANPKIEITGISFDTAAVSGFTHDPVTDLWHVKAPAHPVGKVKVRIKWTLNGAAQTDALLDYEYRTSYKVHFDLGDAAGQAASVPDQAVVSGDMASLPVPAPVWNGHHFTGWFQGTRPWDFGTDPVSGPTTLTAHWDGVSFTLTPRSGPVNTNTPVTITATPQSLPLHFTQASSGGSHTLAISTDGKTYAWGANTNGQLGDTTTNTHTTPSLVSMPAGVRFTRVIAGPTSSFALDTLGRWWAWGNNQYGQLGNGTSISTAPYAQTTPVLVGVPAGVTFARIYPGLDFTLAVTITNTIYTWGNNTSGQLGNSDPTLSPQADPALVSLLGETVSQASVGAQHALILTTSGRLYTWGANQYGQLGNGNTSNQVAPTIVTPPTSGFTSINAGAYSSYALNTAHRPYAWGNNTHGQLGLGDTLNRARPTPIPTLASNTIASLNTSSSSDSAFATDSTGNSWAWGDNRNGQLGTGTPTPISSNNGGTPTPVNITSRLPANTTTIQPGSNHTLTQDKDRNITTWGDNQTGQLGNSTVPTSPASAAHSYTPVGISPGVIQVTGLHFATQPGENLAYDSTNHNWKANTPKHNPDEHVEVNIHWTLNDVPQPDYTVSGGFTFTPLFTLPAAGAIPLQRLTGATFITLTAITAVTLAGYQLSKARKRKAGKHSLRPNQTNSRN